MTVGYVHCCRRYIVRIIFCDVFRTCLFHVLYQVKLFGNLFLLQKWSGVKRMMLPSVVDDCWRDGEKDMRCDTIRKRCIEMGWNCKKIAMKT